MLSETIHIYNVLGNFIAVYPIKAFVTLMWERANCPLDSTFHGRTLNLNSFKTSKAPRSGHFLTKFIFCNSLSTSHI